MWEPLIALATEDLSLRSACGMCEFQMCLLLGR